MPLPRLSYLLLDNNWRLASSVENPSYIIIISLLSVVAPEPERCVTMATALVRRLWYCGGNA